MAVNDIRRRWTRRAILLLVVLNALLWAPFAVSAGHMRVSAADPPAAKCLAPSQR
jgi:hypothetical protein